MASDPHLLTNVLADSQEYHKHLLVLLDIYAAPTLLSLSAYAAAAPAPVARAVLAVAGSFAGADDALRRYADSVEVWEGELRALKGLDEEVGRAVRDRDILVTRLFEQSKTQLSKTSVRSGSNVHLDAVQTELRASEVRLAARKKKLDEGRVGAIRRGLEVRCSMMVECGRTWIQMGEAGLRVLEGIEGHEDADPFRDWGKTASTKSAKTRRPGDSNNQILFPRIATVSRIPTTKGGGTSAGDHLSCAEPAPSSSSGHKTQPSVAANGEIPTIRHSQTPISPITSPLLRAFQGRDPSPSIAPSSVPEDTSDIPTPPLITQSAPTPSPSSSPPQSTSLAVAPPDAQPPTPTVAQLDTARAQIQALAKQEERGRDELQMYSLQLAAANAEILRAQTLLDQEARHREEAEARAEEGQAVAHKLREELVMQRAREEGRREGFRAGFERAGEIDVVPGAPESKDDEENGESPSRMSCNPLYLPRDLPYLPRRDLSSQLCNP
ncbi:hypothetical protein FA95DRAFT_1575350 [Auriscalpium vulgare]|uniref:Uncharacterized protein n=1 Tax=Auriscalpium vulgare TaxID=40419 RepID=A0ACB8RGM0_9AGAM|nr:hypothetical protein FA95DRAFT_1575350 [Auriscalpium vulgare]